jgi:sec-independent protein translocase protein TatC
MTWLKKLFQIREKSDGDIVKPFLDHMEDLRWMLVKVISSLGIAMFAAFFFRTDLMNILKVPLAKVDPSLPSQLVVHNIPDSFMLSIKMAFYAGIVLAFPFLIYFIAGFVLPALTKTEKKYLFPGIFGGFLLFASGVLAAYLYILPQTIRFFFKDTADMGLKPMWTWESYASIFSWLTIGFGLLCELPLVVIVLAMLQMVNYKLLSSTRPYAVVLIFVLAMVIAPTPDPGTMLVLAAPILVLYEACIWIVWFIDRNRAKNADVQDLMS